jgi:hypothetical protein
MPMVAVEVPVGASVMVRLVNLHPMTIRMSQEQAVCQNGEKGFDCPPREIVLTFRSWSASFLIAIDLQ